VSQLVLVSEEIQTMDDHLEIFWKNLNKTIKLKRY